MGYPDDNLSAGTAGRYDLGHNDDIVENAMETKRIAALQHTVLFLGYAGERGYALLDGVGAAGDRMLDLRAGKLTSCDFASSFNFQGKTCAQSLSTILVQCLNTSLPTAWSEGRYSDVCCTMALESMLASSSS